MTPGDRIAELARSYVGCSIDHRVMDLALLVATAPDDNPYEVVDLKTNCGTFTRGVLDKAGVVHDILERRYEIGHAVSDVLTIGDRLGAKDRFRGQPLLRGTILHYATPGENDDHLECCLLEDAGNDVGWCKLHCGAGRPRNAVTQERSDIRWSRGRPLRNVLDPGLLLEPF